MHCLCRNALVLLFLSTLPALAAQPTWDDQKNKKWPPEFSGVEIPSSVDAHQQRAYFRRTESAKPMPLLVSLHTWSGDYTQSDPLAPLAAKADWNYIHPDFRGPNWTPDACMSPKAIADINDAIAYGIAQGKVNEEKVFVVGVSGGGYATTGMYLKSKHRVRAFLAWVPITDLGAWHIESQERGKAYAEHIMKATSSESTLNEEEARRRSPLHWPLPKEARAPIELYAGIDDGYAGSVPISHSLRFFNRLAGQYGVPEDQITEVEIDDLLQRNTAPTKETIADRKVHFRRVRPYASITIFEGGHEMLPEFCFDRLKNLAR
jgi:pimeloyl-ACP methyl ester carboxylesterase